MEDAMQPRQFVRKFHLPQLVRIQDAHEHKLCNDDYTPTTLTDSNNTVLDLDQPFLLYKAYPCRQVIAYTLETDAMGQFKRIGSPLLIPENYPGWFSVVSRDCHTAGYFSTIEQVARAQVSLFMTRDEISAFHIPNLAGEAPTVNQTHSFTKETITAGQALRFLGLYEDISAFVYNSKRNSLSRKHRPGNYKILRYAKCVRFNDHGGDVVFIPITETGRFYIIANKQRPLANAVSPVSDMLRIKLPITVQLVVGPKPRNYQFHVEENHSRIDSNNKSKSNESNEKNFSAILRLEEIRIKDVILACTIRPQPFAFNKSERSSSSLSSSVRKSLKGVRGKLTHNEGTPLLLEFDLDSAFLFYRTFVEKNGSISSRKIPDLVLQCISYCNDEADNWRKQIKIAHDVVPKNSILDEITSSSIKKSSTKKNREPISVDTFDPKLKTASIGSRASSNASKSSRISRVLQHLWNPLRKTKFNEECVTEDEGHESISSSSISEYHHYETLRVKSDSRCHTYNSKEPFSRRATLDIAFPRCRVDDDGYIIKSQRCIDEEEGSEESFYSTIERK